MKHILIDFENVQPEASQLSGVSEENCHIWLFWESCNKNFIGGALRSLMQVWEKCSFRTDQRQAKCFGFLSCLLFRQDYGTGQGGIDMHSFEGRGFDVLVEHLEDTHLCKGIVRLGSLEDAGKNEELLLEMKNNR